MAVQKSFSSVLGRNIAIETIDVDGEQTAVPLVSVSGAGTGGGGGAGTSDTTEATQLLVLAQAQAINADIGAPADTAAPADGAGSYGVIAGLKRGLLNWAALLARLSDLMNVRAYNYAAATRTAVGAASTREALPVANLNATREIAIIANTRCFVRWGDSAVAVAATDAAVHVVEANANYFHLRVPAGATHYAVIRDTADGFVRILPVL